MFRAILRWFEALGYLVTGQLDSARLVLERNPQAVRAKYDGIVREKTGRIHQYKQAVASLVAQEEAKVVKVRELTEEVERLERLKEGALAKARQVAERIRGAGGGPEAVKADEDYRRCLAAYNDFSSTLAEKHSRIAELEGDISEYRASIADHKVQLQGLLRELEKLRAEATDAVADMATAREEKEIAESLAGIAQDGTAEELQRLRQLRHEMKAEVRITKELAGTDTAAQEREFLEYARSHVASDEFDALIGLAPEAENDDSGAAEKTPLPE